MGTHDIGAIQPKTKRRVFYCADHNYAAAKKGAAMLGQSVSDFITHALATHIDKSFSPTTRDMLYATHAKPGGGRKRQQKREA